MTSHDWVMFGDLARVVIFALSAVLVGAIGRVLWVSRHTGMTRWQVARFAALALSTVSVFFTEVGRLHAEVTWRLPVNLLFLVTGCYGVGGLMLRRSRCTTTQVSECPGNAPTNNPERGNLE